MLKPKNVYLSFNPCQWPLTISWVRLWPSDFLFGNVILKCSTPALSIKKHWNCVSERMYKKSINKGKWSKVYFLQIIGIGRQRNDILLEHLFSNKKNWRFISSSSFIHCLSNAIVFWNLIERIYNVRGYLYFCLS